MTNFRKLILSVLMVPVLFGLAITPLGMGAQPVQALERDGVTIEVNLLCELFPFIYDINFTRPLCGAEDKGSTAVETTEMVIGLIKFGVSLIFIGIIILAVYTIIKAAVVYIRSEGDEGKIQESQKAIKAVFVGIGALIVGIIGLVIILALFNAGNAVDSGNPETKVIELVGDEET